MYIYLLYQQNMNKNNGKYYQNPLWSINIDLDYNKKLHFCLSFDLDIHD